MRTLKDLAVFLAQYAGDSPPFNSLAGIARRASA